MGSPEGGDGHRTRAAEDQQPVIYCLIPAALAPKLHELLRRHYAELPDVEVVVEQRRTERRSADERRAAKPKSRKAKERRQTRGPMGRRVGDRRATQVDMDPYIAPDLPRRARRHADLIRFVERLRPSSEEAENREAARIVMRVQAGDREAFGELYVGYFSRLYGYLRVALHDVHEAEDLTQQVFVKALEKLPEYERTEQPVRNWLFAIARNLAISHLRKTGRIELEEPEELERMREADGESYEEPEIPALDWLTDPDLTLFVERLPDPQRQVLILRYMLDLPHAEIARSMDRSLEDVKSLHYRAVGFLRKRLAAIGRTSSGSGSRDAQSYWPVFTQMEVLRHRRFILK
jgi:RNA polymerase sigma-70 factor (ECF subfamily)